MTLPPGPALVDAGDPGTEPARRFEALRALVDHVGGRPIPAPRWKVYERQIVRVLRERAAEYKCTPAEALQLEIDSAVVIASSDALEAATVAFNEVYVPAFRAGVARLVLESLVPDARHADQLESLTDPDDEEIPGDQYGDDDADVESLVAAIDLADKLVERGRLTPAETDAIRRELLDDDVRSLAERVALSKARAKLRKAFADGFEK